MAKKKERVTENANKEADIQSFVDENWGKTLTSEDIEKSRVELKETTKKHYDDNPELQKARKKQVSDYKNYKASKEKVEKVKEEEKQVETKEPVTETVIETASTEVVNEPASETIKEEEVAKNEPVKKEVVEKTETEQIVKPKPKRKSALSAYGSYGMGLMWG